MNNLVFGKTMKNMRTQRDVKLKTTEKRKNYLVSGPNYHTTKFSCGNLLAIKKKNTQRPMNKPVYVELCIPKLSKIVMYEFWFDYVKPDHGEKADLCYMDTSSFTAYIKPNDIWKTCCKLAWQRRISHTLKKSITIIKLWVSFEKSSQNH